MAKKMNIPILGVVENMSYLVCPDCGKKINVFGESHLEEVAEKEGVQILARIPIDPTVAEMVEDVYKRQVMSCGFGRRPPWLPGWDMTILLPLLPLVP